MREFRFQFQYDPSDLKTIRDTKGVVRFSPGTTISVWSAGFAICLLVLGAIGAWLTLAILVVAAISGLMVYVFRLNRNSLADREYVVRTVTFSVTGVVEEFGNSMFHKSWDVYEEFIDAPDHFLLRHYEKLTAVPKRVIPKEDMNECRDLIIEQTNKNLDRRVAVFDEWFVNKPPGSVFQFRWRDEDIEELSSARMRVFQKSAATVSNKENDSSRSFMLPMVMVHGAVVLLILFYLEMGGDFLGVKILLFSLAISIPFFVALVWWKYTSKEAARKRPRIPDEEIFVTLSETDLMIGYPKSVVRYSWKDITSFCYSDQFIGFRPHNGPVHVIANHAFGGLAEAMEFLQTAEKFRLENGAEVVSVGNLEVDETGNPYQPPGFFN